jgi:alpha-tubulin suppressor-like RCC1 family protein
MIEQDAEYFDVATQIEAFEDSSFLITNNGSLYSWGKNDHGFLGRESKFDFKSMSKD